MKHARLITVILPIAAALAAGCDPSGGFSLVGTVNAAFGTDAIPSSRPDATPTTPTDAELLTRDLLAAVNTERAKVGLPSVTLNPELNSIATDYADRLIVGGFFAHNDPETGSNIRARADDRGYIYFKLGENLAAGQRTVDDVMKDWMASPTHRRNILDPDFTEMGIGIRDGGDDGRYWVQEFGRRLGQ